MERFIFDEQKHKYYLDSRRITAISDLIRPLSDVPDSEYLEAAFEIAAERGVTCHSLIEMLLNGEDIEGEYPHEYEPYADAIRLFIAEHDITPVYTETPFYSEELQIAGTPDVICLFDGVLSILDYKFVSQIQKSKVGAQLNAYNLICQDNDIDIEKLYCVHFKNSGGYELYPVAINNEDVGLLLKLRDRKNRKHPRGRIE